MKFTKPQYRVLRYLATGEGFLGRNWGMVIDNLRRMGVLPETCDRETLRKAARKALLLCDLCDDMGVYPVAEYDGEKHRRDGRMCSACLENSKHLGAKVEVLSDRSAIVTWQEV